MLMEQRIEVLVIGADVCVLQTKRYERDDMQWKGCTTMALWNCRKMFQFTKPRKLSFCSKKVLTGDLRIKIG